MQPGKARSVGTLINAAVRGELSKTQALRLCKDNPEVITLALLAAGQRIAEQDKRLSEQDTVIATLQGQRETSQPSPSMPSGMVPIYTKPNTPKRRKKPGAKKGHPGRRRKTPERIDKRETHRLKRCHWGEWASATRQGGSQYNCQYENGRPLDHGEHSHQ